MPEIPIQTPLEYMGVLLFATGIFLTLAGINIIKVEKVTIRPGKKTLIAGFSLIILGVIFLLPITIDKISNDIAAETATLTPDISITSTGTLLPPTQTVQPLLSSPTPVNPATILFKDTFDSNNNGWVTGNFEKTYSKQTRTISGGVFEFGALFTTDNGFTWGNAPDFRAKNFNMSVEVVQIPKSSNADIIIAFRYGNQGSTTYVVAFGSDSSFSFYSSINDEWSLIYQGESNAFQLKEGGTNTFGVRAIEQKFTVYANGQELHTLEDSRFSYEGEIGIGLKGNSGKSILVRFDNLVITEAP